ncbi:MAG: hypothetical protein LBV69_09995 [Bacteroidales bacterium]|jgi:hypothetical protein|nr:hypothetical protein [Bacteroidales bacterium]
MKKIFFAILAIFFLTNISNAQSLVNFGLDKTITLPKMNDYQRILGSDSDALYTLRINEKDELYLDLINANSLVKESETQLVMPIMNGINSKFVAMYYLDSKLVLLTEIMNNTSKEKTLYIQQVDYRNGQITGEPKAIGKLTGPNTTVGFKVQLTPNKQNIFVSYNRNFQTYNDEPFFFKVYDPNLKEIYNKTVKLPMTGKAFEIDQVEIGNSGNVYMLARISPDARTAQRMKTVICDYKLLVFNATNGNITPYDLKGKKLQLFDAIIGVDENENVDVFGFMVRKGKDTYEAIYHQKLDKKTGKFRMGDAKKSDYIFTKKDLPEFRASRLSKNMKEIYNYKLLGVTYLENGGAAVIAEHQNYWKDSIKDPQTKKVTYSDYYKFNDILIAYCDPANNMEWMTRIPKSQYSYNDLGMYSSVAFTSVGEKIILFYNDNSSNLKSLQSNNTDGSKYKELSSPSRSGISVVVSVFSDGKFTGSQLFNKNDSYRIMPEFVKEFNYRTYMLAQDGKKVKFVQYTGR